MNQLTNPLQAIIDAASQKAASPDMKKLAEKHQQKSNNSGKRFVLADISGSMSESVGASTKYELLKKALSDPIIDWTAQQLIAFNSIPERCFPNTLPQPSANTALHKAIDYIVDKKPAFTLIISDGQPDDEKAALAAADKLTGVIDILFIGSDSDLEAIAFLKKLSSRSGNSITKIIMQQITYNNYPTLLFLSYNRENAPTELPFEVASFAVRDYLTRCAGYNELFAYITVKNSLEKKNTNTNYLLTDKAFALIEYNAPFRNEQFRNFFHDYVKPKHGVIMMKEGGQYVYLLLGKNETKALKKKEGRYMVAALFKDNFFLGFEEGIITDRGIDVLPTGHYDGGMDLGGYLSFCIITLAYTNSKQLPVYQSDSVTETIFEV